ncbi:MAG TPA: MFS transporter [Bacteroidales bacterium]|nr:MFS transporter [Bacteroidales bacterium]
MFYNKLTYREKITFRAHFVFTVLEGLVFGTSLMNEFVFLRSLKGTEFLVGLLFLISMVVYITLILSNEITRRIANKKKLIRITALITRLPLLLFLLFPSAITQSNASLVHAAFLGILFFYYLGTAITLPTINLLLKHNYRNNNFGKLYGYATSANKTATLVSTMIFGFLLDSDYFAFRWVYPAIGILGVLGYYALSTVPFRQSVPVIKEKIFTSVRNSFGRMISIFKNDKPFLHFQMAYFSYGIAFMITATVITFFLESYLSLSYSVISGYKTMAGIVTVLLIPMLGILMDKIDQRKFGTIMFSFMLLYVTGIMLTQFFPIKFSIGGNEIYLMLIFAFISMGVFNAAGTLSWNVSSTYFSKDINKTGDYQAVHITLTGVRSLFAPLGVVIYKLFDFTYTFVISIVFLILALIILRISQKQKYI